MFFVSLWDRLATIDTGKLSHATISMSGNSARVWFKTKFRVLVGLMKLLDIILALALPAK